MLHIVLYQPEIPENTGNITRTCVGFNARLHLIRPYGFFLNNAKLKRSAVNYWDKLDLKEYDSFNDFLYENKITKESKIYYVTRYGQHTPNEIIFNSKNDIYLVFGKESTGIDKEILKSNFNKTIRIPTSKNIRALNLSNCVAMLAYKYAEQNNFENLCLREPHKRFV